MVSMSHQLLYQLDTIHAYLHGELDKEVHKRTNTCFVV